MNKRKHNDNRDRRVTGSGPDLKGDEGPSEPSTRSPSTGFSNIRAHTSTVFPLYQNPVQMKGQKGRMPLPLRSQPGPAQERSDQITPPLQNYGPPGNDVIRIVDEYKFLEELECARCKNMVSDPINVCLAGHFTCNSCRTFNTECARCGLGFAPEQERGRLGGIETLIALLEIRCVNNGCEGMLKIKDLAGHEKACNFRPVVCSQQHVGECNSLEVSMENYVDHLLTRHRSESLHGAPPLKIPLNLETTNPPFTFNFSGEIFIVNSNKDKRNSLRIWVSAAAPEVEAAKFLATFRIEKQGEADSSKYLEWKSRVHGLHCTSDEALRHGDCGYFHSIALKPYSTQYIGKGGRLCENEINVKLELRRDE